MPRVRFPFEKLRPTDAIVAGNVDKLFQEECLRWWVGIGVKPFRHGVPFVYDNIEHYKHIRDGIDADGVEFEETDWREWDGKLVPIGAQSGSFLVHGLHCPVTLKHVTFRPTRSKKADWKVDLKVAFDFRGTGFRNGSVQFEAVPCSFRGVSMRLRSETPLAIKRATKRLEKYVDMAGYKKPVVKRGYLSLSPKR